MTGLAPFRARLLGGVHASIAHARRPDHDQLDEDALGGWSRDDFAALTGIREDPPPPGDESQETITRLAGQLRERRGLLPAVIFSPDKVLSRLLEWSGTSLSAASGEGLVDGWIAMCWAAEAAWSAVTGDVPGTTLYAAGDMALLRPVAARTRFLVLSEPMRWRAEVTDPWWLPEADQVFGGNGVLERALGPESWNELAGRCRQARREWLDCLDAYQSHPLLSQVKPGELEQELRTLAFRRAGSWRSRSAPLGLSVLPLVESAPLTAEDTALIADVVERHLLPRFAILTVARLALYDDRGRWRLLRLLFALFALAAGLGSVACAIGLEVHLAVRLAAGCYALICVGVLVLPPGWGAMWLLRMPAAAAVGVIALISFLPGSWIATPQGGWLAAGTLAAASAGYLLIEARNHSAAPWAALHRALLVAVVGAAHAVMVALIGLVVVAPAFISSAGKLGALWKDPGYGHAGVVLALAAAWCLAIGVFSQILWEDRPITAALAHLSWRRGG